jgi:Na+-transporting NADH:ubiquinone oxidoreductase subunit C
MAEESTRHNFTVTATLAVVCSLLVSVTAIGLSDRKETNRQLDRKRNILAVAGLYDEAVPVDEAFAAIETRVIDLETGDFVETGAVPEDYDQRLALSSPNLSVPVPADEDIAGLSRKEKYSYVYLVRDGDRLEQVIVPVRGRGLFSTLYAYLSLDADLETVRGIAFYEHGETAGLGAEVENPAWTAKWPDKRMFGDDGSVRLAVVKGVVDPASPNADYEVDGLSGATMTSSGVTRLVQYWFGGGGFGPFLAKLPTEEGAGG